MKTINQRFSHLLALLVCGALLAPGHAQQSKAGASPVPEPETIYSVYHVKPGREAIFAEARARTWALYRRLDLVLPKPHIAVRGTEDSGKTYFVEIFTWRDAAIPDHAPKEVRLAWQELEAACEPRGGRPGIDFSDGGVTLVEGD